MQSKFILSIFVSLSLLTACAGTVDKNTAVTGIEKSSYPMEDKEAMSSSEEAEVLIKGVSMESLGCTVDLSGTIEFTEKSNKSSNSLENFSSVVVCGETMRKSFISGIMGESSALTVDVPFINGAYQIPSLCLQGFQSDELSRDSTRIKIGNQTYRPQELEQYLVLRDSEITIFDILPLVQPGKFKERLQSFIDAENEALQSRGDVCEIVLDNYQWTLQVDEYLRKNIANLLVKS